MANFYICQTCSVVDSDRDRQKVGSPCKQCGTPSPSARFHFGLNSLVLVNALQDFYFLRGAKPPADRDGLVANVYSNETDTRIVMPVLFCALWDTLTTQLCQNVMRAKLIPEEEEKRLLQKFKFARDRRTRLLPELTSEQWDDALAALPNSAIHIEHFNFFRQLNTKRNAFIHEGSPWQFKDDELEQIPEEVWPSFNLFAQLHNRYVVS